MKPFISTEFIDHSSENIFVLSVNYKSSHGVAAWHHSAKSYFPNARFIIVDNFSSFEERQRIIDISSELDIILIKSPNIGYGQALNVALDYLRSNHIDILDTSFIFAGNLDVTFARCPTVLPTYPIWLSPIVREKSRNRNPFMTKLQRSVAPILYWPAAKWRSRAAYLAAITINKAIGLIPSKPYATHGSMFCFSGASLSLTDSNPFNQNSFLYWEEIEFADHMNRISLSPITSDIEIIHHRKISTKDISNSIKNTLPYWAQSWNSWNRTL